MVCVLIFFYLKKKIKEKSEVNVRFFRRNAMKMNQTGARCDDDGPFCLHFYATSREITGSSIVCVFSCIFVVCVFLCVFLLLV